jgi:ssDNA-binding Zn-finger/Zn-ribbon topoisomerase 1
MAPNLFDPFIHKIWVTVVPLALLAIVVGTVLRLFCEGIGKWIGTAIRDFKRVKRAEVYEQMTDDKMLDAPHCPNCAGLMVERTAKKGASAGQAFWGCNSFPKCRGTRKI